MRIFIALLFENEKRDIINDILGEVRGISDSGNFTSKNNLHLTIQYIGETSEAVLSKIKDNLCKFNFSKFDYETNRIKYFKKSNSRIIVYLGVDKTEYLEDLYHKVRAELRNAGCELQSGKFTPHITLGRQVKINKNKSIHNVYCNKLLLHASKISVMESKRVNNKLVYEELFNIPLK